MNGSWLLTKWSRHVSRRVLISNLPPWLAHWKYCRHVNISLYSDTLYWFQSKQTLLSLLDVAFLSEIIPAYWNCPLMKCFSKSMIVASQGSNWHSTNVQTEILFVLWFIIFIWTLAIYISRWNGWNFSYRFNSFTFLCLSQTSIYIPTVFFRSHCCLQKTIVCIVELFSWSLLLLLITNCITNIIYR